VIPGEKNFLAPKIYFASFPPNHESGEKIIPGKSKIWTSNSPRIFPHFKHLKATHVPRNILLSKKIRRFTPLEKRFKGFAISNQMGQKSNGGNGSQKMG